MGRSFHNAPGDRAKAAWDSACRVLSLRRNAAILPGDALALRSSLRGPGLARWGVGRGAGYGSPQGQCPCC